MERKNLFSGIPAHLPEEFVEVLAEGAGIRIERIVSRGHASPPDFWYDQKEAEWVLLLSGSARVRFEGEREPMTLIPGDYLNIPARTRHRVEGTDPLADTIWLTVYYRE